MAITLDGTLGITTPAETVQGALTTTGNTILGDATTDTLNVGNGGLVKDASGNVGIGTASPNQLLTVYKSDTTNAGIATTAAISLYNPQTVASGYGSAIRFYGDTRGNNNFAGIGGMLSTGGATGSTGYLAFYTKTAEADALPTERMRIDSSGNLLVGTTSTAPRNLVSGSGIKLGSAGEIEAGGASDTNFINITAASGNMLSFRRQGAGVGTISTTGSTTSYGTTSDYRLKNTIAPMTGALATVSQLKPVTYSWKADGSAGQGFIAHELQAIVPDCVTGEKDAVNEDGTIKPQGIDTSFLVATLTAAIQEQQALIIQLQADVATLKALSA